MNRNGSRQSTIQDTCCMPNRLSERDAATEFAFRAPSVMLRPHQSTHKHPYLDLFWQSPLELSGVPSRHMP